MKKLLFVCLITVSVFDLSAQQDEQMSLYMYNPLYFNPAYAGSRDAISNVAMARFQWVNFKGAPMSQWFSIHSPIMHKSLGVGGHFINDQIGNRKRTSAYADVSGSVQLNKNQDRLAAGISLGADIMGYDFTNSTVNDVTDPYYGKSFSVTKPNLGAGLYYYGKRHYLGISVPRLFQTKAEFNSIVETITARHFFVSAGYVFDINSVLKFKPSTLIKYTPHAPITFDLNASLLMYEKIWTGLMYRYNESMGINVVYNIKQTFQVGYVYDFPINGLRTYQSGSHEIVLQYDIQPKKSVYTSPRYF
jgi:type IX secretion system PorP/SprF family membrane protein